MEASFPVCFLSHGDFTLVLTIRDEHGYVVVSRDVHFEVQ